MISADFIKRTDADVATVRRRTAHSIRSQLRHDSGSAVVGWTLVAPLVIAVALAAVDLTHAALMSSRIHAVAARIAYAVATASDDVTHQRAATALARAACSHPQVTWHQHVVAGVPMVVVALQCQVPTAFGVSRLVLSRARAPLEIP